jgi:ribonuclease HII
MLEPYFTRGILEAGCDEAGRGCLAGPVFAAAVILPEQHGLTGLNDSKKLVEAARYALRPRIEEIALAYAVASVEPAEIDEINILNASFLAMHRALEMLDPAPQHILVDGNRFRNFREIPHRCIIKGDGKYLSIAAASVLAKTYRDDYMRALHEQNPLYGWDRNKGYPTIRHREAIVKFGITEYHRRSFRLTDGQLNIDF